MGLVDEISLVGVEVGAWGLACGLITLQQYDGICMETQWLQQGGACIRD